MRPKHRIGLPVIILIFLASATPLLAEVAVTAFPLTQARWPYGLDLIRRNPFGSFVGLALALAVITFLLFWWRTRDTDPLEIPTTDIVEITEGRESEKARSRPAAVLWPRQLGTLPLAADCYQPRRVGKDLGPASAGYRLLIGDGGVGKTQLAADYARSRWGTRSVDLLLWVTASSRDAVLSDYARAGIAVAAADPGDVERAAQQFLLWLGTTDHRWLIVLDDVGDPGDLKGLWPPPRTTGDTLVTTRRRDAALSGAGRRRVEVGVFAPDEAVAYLAAKLAVHGRTEPRQHMAALATDLGYLPIAMSQAVAYLIDTGLDCAAYRVRWSDRRLTLPRLLPPVGGLPDDQRAGLAAMWSLSVQRANDLPPAGIARPMLELASELDSNGIPFDVLTSEPVLVYLRDTHLDASDRGSPADVRPHDASDALFCLQRLSLAAIDRDSPLQEVRVHALLQRAVREAMPVERQRLAARAAADAILAVWPEVDRDTYLAQVLRSNAEWLEDHSDDALWTPRAHRVLFRAGVSLGEAGLASAAIDYWNTLHETAVRRLGRDHEDTLEARANLARYQGRAGDAVGAVAAYRSLLADAERVLGPDHPETLSVRHGLARYRGEVGDAGGAAQAFRELFADRERVLGPDHADTLYTRTNHALWCGEAGDASRAAASFERLVPDVTRALGPDHWITLDARTHAAWWQGVVGNVREAAEAFALLVPDVERVLGPDHPDTFNARNHLARWRSEAGDLAGASAAFQKLFDDRLRVLGPDHPDTLNTRHSLAYVQSAMGNTAGAAEAFQSLLSDVIRVLGPEHPDTMATRNHAARFRGEAGDPAGAADAIAVLLAEQKRVLGPDHPDTLHTRHSLARWRGEAGDPDAAVADLRELLRDQSRILSPDHPEIMTTRAHLARFLGRAGHPDLAVAMLRDLVADRRRILGPEHPETLHTRHDLADWQEALGDRQAAVSEYEGLLTDEQRVLGPDHPETRATRQDLGSLRRREQRPHGRRTVRRTVRR